MANGLEISASSEYSSFVRLELMISVAAERFAGCYTVEHWHMPSVKTLSYMAQRATSQILTRVPIVHLPTLNMSELSACLSFAICTIGSVRIGPRAGDLPTGTWRDVGMIEPITSEDDGSTERGSVEQREMENWKSGQIVRHEKTHMLVKVSCLVLVRTDDSPLHEPRVSL